MVVSIASTKGSWLALAAAAAAAALMATAAQAAVVTYDWNITYVANVNADGLFARRVIGVNGAFPVPAIHVALQDTLVINVHNQLDVPTALHAHGLFQTRNAQFDGPSMVTQCPIPPGAKFTYNIPIENHGTYWIHGHFGGQYVDGLRAPLIISHNVQEAYKYDEEYTLALADWYHTEHTPLLQKYLDLYNPSGAEPIPESGLVNQQTNARFTFVPGKVYRLRLINMSALAMFHFHIDGHQDLTIIEVDGVDVEPYVVSSLPIASAQRYSVLVTAKPTVQLQNYLIHADMDPTMFDDLPDGLELNVTATAVYIDSPKALLAPVETSEWPEFVDTQLVPLTPEASRKPDVQFVLDADFQVMDDYINKGTFNEITYVPPKVPTLFTALSMKAENLSSIPEVYGKFTHPMVVQFGQVVEMVINNNDDGTHPFHLHGHVFQVVGRSEEPFDPENPYYGPDGGIFENPMRRDTVVIPGGGSVAIRFVADNPGVWLFHCHIEWHLQAGLATTLIEAPEVMYEYVTIPQLHKDQCQALGIPFSGNAAGKSGLDLDGANLGPMPMPGTFTFWGIVALVSTIVSAIVGLYYVVWYGTTMHEVDERKVRQRMAQSRKKRDSLQNGRRNGQRGSEPEGRSSGDALLPNAESIGGSSQPNGSGSRR